MDDDAKTSSTSSPPPPPPPPSQLVDISLSRSNNDLFSLACFAHVLNPVPRYLDAIDDEWTLFRLMCGVVLLDRKLAQMTVDFGMIEEGTHYSNAFSNGFLWVLNIVFGTKNPWPRSMIYSVGCSACRMHFKLASDVCWVTPKNVVMQSLEGGNMMRLKHHRYRPHSLPCWIYLMRDNTAIHNLIEELEQEQLLGRNVCKECLSHGYQDTTILKTPGFRGNQDICVRYTIESLLVLLHEWIAVPELDKRHMYRECTVDHSNNKGV